MPSDLAAVFRSIDDQRTTSVDRLLDYLRHPSISAENIGIQEVADLLVSMLTGLGLATTLVPTSGHPMVVARWEKAPDKPTVLLYGHYDVQPPDPVDAWTTPPFEPTIRDGRIYARGVADNKGQQPGANPSHRGASSRARRLALQRDPAARGRGGGGQSAYGRVRARARRVAAGRSGGDGGRADACLGQAQREVRIARCRLVRVAGEARQARPAFRQFRAGWRRTRFGRWCICWRR